MGRDVFAISSSFSSPNLLDLASGPARSQKRCFSSLLSFCPEERSRKRNYRFSGWPHLLIMG